MSDIELKNKIRPLALTPEKLAFLTNFVRRTHGRFDSFIADSSDAQLAEAVLVSSEFAFELGEWSGVVALFPCRPGFDANIHVSVWDPMFFRRPALGHAILRYCFKKWSLRRIFAVIPEKNHLANHLASSLGMTQEGRIRSAFVYNGEAEAGLLWGVLPEEV